MTGYIFVLLSTLCGSAKGFAGKKSSSDLDTFSKTLFFGALRTLMCAVIGAAVCIFKTDISTISSPAILISVLSGISMSVFLLTWIVSVRRGAYVQLDVCCQTGIVIPCILAAPILGEKVTVMQYAAFAFLIPAISLLSDRGKKATSKMKPGDIFLLFAVWLSSGVNSLTVKLYSSFTDCDTSFYNLVTFSVAAIVFASAYFIMRREKPTLPKIHYTVYLPMMAICLYLNIFLQAVAAKHLDSMILFPLQTVLGLFFSYLMAVFLFKEKPTAKNTVGLFIATAAIIAINML